VVLKWIRLQKTAGNKYNADYLVSILEIDHEVRNAALERRSDNVVLCHFCRTQPADEELGPVPRTDHQIRFNIYGGLLDGKIVNKQLEAGRLVSYLYSNNS